MLRRPSKKESAALTRQIPRNRVHNVFSPKLSPAITISRGETIVVETQDCYGGRFKEETKPHSNVDQSPGIPLTGPIYVEEAHIGDVLSVQVKQIKTADTGVFAVRPETGVPGQDIQEGQVRVLDVDEKHVQLESPLKLPLNPVIGNIGVAAKHGEIDTVYPGRHGGNMDTVEITTGSRIYLPVQVNGALLSLGDVKACMGDGQIAGSGVEVEAEVTLRVDTLPGGRFSWPRVESKGEWITITSASTVDQAARLAITEMVKWISQDKGLDFDTAYSLVSLGGGLRISQWGNPLITARMVFPKRLITKIKSLPNASGRLNYRSLPPKDDSETIEETIVSETEKPPSRSSRRVGSSRSQRSPGGARKTGARGSSGKKASGTTSRSDSDATQDKIAKGNNDLKKDRTNLKDNSSDKDPKQIDPKSQKDSSPDKTITLTNQEDPQTITEPAETALRTSSEATSEEINTVTENKNSDSDSGNRSPSYGRKSRRSIRRT